MKQHSSQSVIPIQWELLSFRYTSEHPDMQMHECAPHSFTYTSYMHPLWDQWGEQQPIHSISWWSLLAVKAVCVHVGKYLIGNFCVFVLAVSLCTPAGCLYLHHCVSVCICRCSCLVTQLSAVWSRVCQSFGKLSLQNRAIVGFQEAPTKAASNLLGRWMCCLSEAGSHD